MTRLIFRSVFAPHCQRLLVELATTANEVRVRVMSALPPKADIAERDRHVRFVPKADSCTAAKSSYSITASAVVSSDGGMVRPSALAAFRLITSSYLVGA